CEDRPRCRERGQEGTEDASQVQPGRHRCHRGAAEPPASLASRKCAPRTVDRKRYRVPQLRLREGHPPGREDYQGERHRIPRLPLRQLRNAYARNRQGRHRNQDEGRTVPGASWLVAWLALLLALFVIAATIIPPRGD